MNNEKRYAVCVRNDGYEESLDLRKIYEVLEDEDAAQDGLLRVIDEDRVAPGQGFGKHPHRDMEIISYVLDGELEHKDSMGTGSVIRPGDVQRMSAGSGVFHSEYNPSTNNGVHFLQIWIEPQEHGIEPSYEEKALDRAQLRGKLTPVAAPNPNGSGAVTIHQDAKLFATVLEDKDQVDHKLDRGRHDNPSRASVRELVYSVVVQG